MLACACNVISLIMMACPVLDAAACLTNFKPSVSTVWGGGSGGFPPLYVVVTAVEVALVVRLPSLYIVLAAGVVTAVVRLPTLYVVVVIVVVVVLIIVVVIIVVIVIV